MRRLRNASLLARLVLAWFALSLGVAVAAPAVQPQGLEWVCSGAGGMKLLLTGSADGQAASGAGIDCPLCSALDAPPHADAARAVAAPAGALPARGAAHAPAAARGLPPPARGPPAGRLTS